MKTESAPAKIKIAFTQLMQQNTFDKITVAAIVKATGINRGTFYLHYEDKYALVEILAADLLSAIQQIVHDNPGSKSEILTPTGTRDCQEPIDQIATLLQTGSMSDDWHALYHHN